MRSWGRLAAAFAAISASPALFAQNPPAEPDPAQTPPVTKPPAQNPPKTEPPTRTEPPVQKPVDLAPTGVPVPPKKRSWTEDLAEWFKTQISDRTTITGYRRLGYHQHEITGDREAFNLSNYYGFGNRRFTDFGNIYVDGRNVLGVLNFNFNIQDDRYQDPQGEKFSIDYKRGLWDISIGDTYASLLNTNRLASFSKSLRGASVGYKSGGLQAKVMMSEVKGEPRTIAINGNNSAGPYFLQSNQIVRGSERVEVDGVPQNFGTDYTIDYDLGAISFVNRSTLEGKIIPPTSTIVISYEAFSFSGDRGKLTAGGLSYDMGRSGRVGFTVMSQRTGASGGLSTRLEKFQGYGPSSIGYGLQLEPLPGAPIVIRIDGVLQVQGVDYVFDSGNPAIFYINRFVPSTSTVDVLYTPKPTNTVDGDRQTLGLDYRYPLGDKGKYGSITYSRALGELTNTPTPQKGTAEALDLRWKRGDYEVFGSLRSIPNDFVSVQTTGFNRNEKASDLRFAYRPNESESLVYGLEHANSAISQRSTQSNGSVVFVPTRFTRATAFVRSTPFSQNSKPWTLEHTRTMSRNLQGETRIDTSSFSTGRNWGPLGLRLGLSHQDAEGPATINNVLANRHVKLDTIELRGTYVPDPTLNFSLSTSLSRVNAGSDSGNGRDIQFGATWRPNDRFNVGINYTDSDAGALATLGAFNSGYGLGYNGNGFSGGIGGSGLLGVSNLQRMTLNTQWQPWDRLNLGLGASHYRTKGAVSSNTETDSIYFTADYDLNDFTRIAGTLSADRTSYIESSFRSNATNWFFAIDGAPPGRFTYNATLSGLVTGGNSTFRQNSNAYDLRASYLLHDRHSLMFTYTKGGITGYYPQDTTDWAITYQYQIWKSLALNVSYRVRDVFNRDPFITSGEYHSRGIDIELAFNFGM